MRRFILFTGLFLISTVTAFAQPAPPSSTYLQDMRTWLKANWYDGYFGDLGYSGARMQMYGFVDANGGMIEGIYTGFQQASGFVTFPDPINAEHVVPQSFFGSATPMRSDIYNLRPSHGSANSARGNNPYGEVPDNLANWYGVDGGGAYVSTSTEPSPNENWSELNANIWEPREEKKGDIARNVFYFYTMYPTQAGPIGNVGDINILYQWHLNDPVDASELDRNDRVEIAQGNRNPYVDYADLVYLAWFYVAVPGCTDPVASNYDPSATEDDGSCQYANPLGCTYAQALNYSPSATTDDGSCQFPVYVSGCTYFDASNYNVSANFDDGSCVFNLAPDCPLDLNDDNLVNVGDLLIFTAGYGVACP